MDPLSITAGTAGFLSLTFQLFEKAQEIHRFLRDVSEAPDEFVRLIDRVEKLLAILDDVKGILQAQEKNNGASDPPKSLLGALELCKPYINVLQELVKKVESSYAKPGKMRRTWTSIKLVLKKNDIREFESQLGQAVNILNSTYLLQMQIDYGQKLDAMTKAMTSQPSSVAEQPTVPIVAPTPGSASSQQLTRSARKTIRKTSPWVRRMIFGTITSFSNTTSPSINGRGIGDYEDEENSTTTYTFVPAFVGKCYQYGVHKSFGRVIGRSLTTWTIVPWSRLRCISKLPLDKLQLALRDLNAGIYIMDEHGKTLLHCAARNHNPELCQFLIGQGLDPDREDCYGSTSVSSWKTKGVVQDFDTSEQCALDTMRILVQHCDTGLSEKGTYNFICMAWQSISFDAVEMALNFVGFEENVKDFDINLALRRFVSRGWPSVMAEAHHKKYHKRMLLKLVCLGADIHTVDEYGRTLLEILLDYREIRTSYCSRVVADKWLDVLSEAGIDPAQYLRTESQRAGDERLLGERRNAQDRLLVFRVDPGPCVHWEWFVVQDRPGSMICEEYVGLAVENDFYSDWNRQRGFWWTKDALRDWPYFDTRNRMDCHMEHYRARHDDSDWYSHLCQEQGSIEQKRFLRRRRCKKEAKLQAKLAARRRAKVEMPGSWVN